MAQNETLPQLTAITSIESGDLLYLVRNSTLDRTITGANLILQFGNGNPPPTTTVAGLPSAAAFLLYSRAISNADAPVIGNPVVGGGTTVVIVRSNGADWIVVEIL